MTSVELPTEVVDLATRWCAPCPVAQECLTDGRATHGWGLYGGIVLVDGRLASRQQATLEAVPTQRTVTDAAVSAGKPAGCHALDGRRADG